jgi:hypothetical protein
MSTLRFGSELVVIAEDSIEHAGGCNKGHSGVWGCLVGEVRNLAIIRSCPEDVSGCRSVLDVYQTLGRLPLPILSGGLNLNRFWRIRARAHSHAGLGSTRTLFIAS